jgi:ubiquinone/menaquinone biosynthesis C-methylase UbiE
MTDTSEYFTGLADDYDRHRPGYPPAVFEAALAGLPRPAAAADVGCGTGISSRLLAAAGATVTGIDPNRDMLEQARARDTPGAVYRAGSAEATGLDDGSVDLVLCAQAFHWFDDETALAEFHRILRPGGRLALLWNVRREEATFMVAYEDLIRRAQEDTLGRGRLVRRNRGYDLAASGLFTEVRTLEFDNPHPLDREGLLGRARSASYFPREKEPAAVMERALNALFDEHARDGRVVLEQVARLTLGERA